MQYTCTVYTVRRCVTYKVYLYILHTYTNQTDQFIVDDGEKILYLLCYEINYILTEYYIQ